MASDWDLDFFGSFLKEFPMTFEKLKRNIRMAVNHDTNIERIVTRGLVKIGLEQVLRPRLFTTVTKHSEQNGRETAVEAPRQHGHDNITAQPRRKSRGKFTQPLGYVFNPLSVR